MLARIGTLLPGLFLQFLLIALTFVTGPALAEEAKAKTEDIAAQQTNQNASAEDDQMLRAMSDELSRSMRLLQLPHKAKPYYIRYELFCQHELSLSYQLGLMCSQKELSSGAASVELRIGSPQFDSSSKEEHLIEGVVTSDKHDYWGVRQALWTLTDQAYKDSLQAFAQAETYKAGHKLRHLCESFSKEEANHAVSPETDDTGDADLGSLLSSLSLIYKDYPHIRTGYVVCDCTSYTRRVTTSEGTVTRHSRTPHNIALVAYVRGADGIDDWDAEYFAADKASQLPEKSSLEKRTREILQALSDYANADQRDHYYGPVLFEQQAASELVEHGLGPMLCAIPGDNLQPTSGLLQSLNMRILPDFLSITDDPHLKEYRGVPVAGHSSIDSEGMNTQKVQLVDHGFLKGLLSGRTPVYSGEHSNGHNLAEFVQTTTLVVEADPEHCLSPSAMRQKLIELARKRGLKEAIIVRRITPAVGLILGGGGINARSDSIVGANLSGMYAVDVETGKETRIRGLNIREFGRPQMDSIVAAGDDSRANMTVNWTGNVRSLITPSLLMDNVELQERAVSPLSPYPLTNPYYEHVGKKHNDVYLFSDPIRPPFLHQE